jgi:hypothetical protein
VPTKTPVDDSRYGPRDQSGAPRECVRPCARAEAERGAGPVPGARHQQERAGGRGWPLVLFLRLIYAVSSPATTEATTLIPQLSLKSSDVVNGRKPLAGGHRGDGQGVPLPLGVLRLGGAVQVESSGHPQLESAMVSTLEPLK